ncbi:MAG: hypothetical protein QNK18_10260 [Gammaproteobacteria bacterium]|nr:hypothetical protein [Gammaproteobacteria bacterium]
MLTVLSVGARAACEPGPEIVTNPGRHGPYYHLCLGLRAAMVDFGSSDRETHAGGQFEVRVERDSFPVAAPACRGAIILRMPWTALQKRAYEAKVSAKRRLLARIRALEESREALLPVAIELNPYMRVLSRGPAVIELTGCNVFFRHADGGYVDHLQPWMRVP